VFRKSNRASGDRVVVLENPRKNEDEEEQEDEEAFN
jgi:hypothetical protein